MQLSISRLLAVVLRIRKDRTAHDSRSAPLPKPVFLWHAMQNDIDIFRGIKSGIQKNPENFKPAGQWLDGYCQNVIKKAKQHRKNLPRIISEKQKEAKLIKGSLAKTRKEISKLKDKSEINEQEEKLSDLFAKANQLSLKEHDLKREIEHLKGKSQDEPGFTQLMSKAFEKAACEYPPNSRKIMLIARLLTDKYLSESKLGITKYEQYVFNNEVRESEGNGPKRLVSEQELAKDAVLARPEATEIIQDAYLSYQGLFPGESIGTAVQRTPPERNGGKAEENQNQDYPAIDDKELTILVELAESSDKTSIQVEIEAATSIKRGTLKDKLQRLESIGLIHRPLGKRKGYQITDKGREIANRNQ